MTYEAPAYWVKAFTCPHCGVYAQMAWTDILQYGSMFARACICRHCNKPSLWAAENTYSREESGNMFFPCSTIAPQPHADMPDDVKQDYTEAASIVSKSPRAAAALLRLGLQKLCKHLGEPGKHIDTDIRSLAAKHVLSAEVVKVADTVRITGNNAVHPGEMSDDDVDYVASNMFKLLNYIVEKGIAEPKELQELYEMTPEAARKAAEDKDAKALAAGGSS